MRWSGVRSALWVLRSGAHSKTPVCCRLTHHIFRLKRAAPRSAAAAVVAHDFPQRTAVIRVTGTDGKTTTSSILESILIGATATADAPAGHVGVVTTVNARIGGREIDTGLHVTTPDAPDVQRFLAEMRDAGRTYAVVESTSHGLHQRRVGSVSYDVAVVTNITHEHLDYHGTRDAYVAAKALLFRTLYAGQAKRGVPRCAILNADDAGSYEALRAALADEAADTGRTVAQRSYSLDAEGVADETGRADVRATNILYRPDATGTPMCNGGRPSLCPRVVA